LGDDHAGNKLGLLNPETKLPEETETGEIIYKTPELTEIQKFLWQTFTEEYLPKIKILAGDDEIVLIKMGDGTQGMKYVSELVSTRMADQMLIQYKNIEPLLQLPNISSVRLVKGTGAHSFGEGSSDLLLEDWIRQRYPNLDVKSLYHGCANINGAVVDYAHHGPSAGIRAWLRGNVLRLYVQSLMMDDILAKRLPPHIVVRAHVHTPRHEYVSVGDYGCWGLITPPLCFPGEFARQVTQSVRSVEIGITACEILNSDGQVTVIPHKITTKLDIRTKEIL